MVRFRWLASGSRITYDDARMRRIAYIRLDSEIAFHPLVRPCFDRLALHAQPYVPISHPLFQEYAKALAVVTADLSYTPSLSEVFAVAHSSPSALELLAPRYAAIVAHIDALAAAEPSPPSP